MYYGSPVFSGLVMVFKISWWSSPVWSIKFWMMVRFVLVLKTLGGPVPIPTFGTGAVAIYVVIVSE